MNTLTSSISTRVKLLFCDHFGITVDQVSEASHIYNDFCSDSLDQIELLMACEDEFDLEISDEEAETIKTVGDAITFVTQKLTP